MHAQRNRAPRWRPPSDDLVLAATDRAYRHDYGERASVALMAIADHLAMEWNPITSRRLRPIVDRLTQRGLLERARHHGRDGWTPTEAGSRQLVGALARGVGDDLPESPQHRQWRIAREHAAARLEGLCSELGELLAEVGAMLSAELASSTEWLTRAKALHDLAGGIGVAVYCLHERPEPSDDKPDHDDTPLPLGAPVSWRHYWLWDAGRAA